MRLLTFCAARAAAVLGAKFDPPLTMNGWDPVSFYRDPAVAAEYDRKRFNGLTGRFFVAIERRALRKALAGLPPAGRVLDLPCGTGRLAEFLLERGYSVVGGDISAAMLDIAHRRLSRFGERFKTEIIDARQWAGPPEQFDIALCARVLMHFPLAEQIAFLRGVAGASSRYVILIHTFRSPYQKLRRLVRGLLTQQRGARHPVDNGELAELLAAAGLTEKARHYLAPVLSESFVLVAEKTCHAENAST